MSTARSLELFFIDGRPDGMLTAEVFNWTGHVLRIPRTQLKDGLNRPEARFTGVYVLLGEQDGDAMAYVGEAEDMAARLRNHAANKDWWDTAILITTSADNLHKAHVKYLEARLIAIARDVNAMALENGNQPSGSSLSEADTANMESYLDTLMMVLPAIRVDNFLSKKRAAETRNTAAKPSETFTIHISKHNITATAIINHGEVVVQKGSTAKLASTSQSWARGREIFEELVAANILEIRGGLAHFVTDYAFKSPSAASDIITGHSSNGRLLWKSVKSGKTYADWENAQLAEAAP